jgi:hypothetical protein
VHTDGEALLQLWIKHWGDIFAVRDWQNRSDCRTELTKKMVQENAVPRPVRAPPRSRDTIAALQKEIPEGSGSVSSGQRKLT